MQSIHRSHPSAQINAPATRDMTKEFGHGTARRHEPNMLPVKQTRIRLAGRTVRPLMSVAREVRRDLVAGGNARNVVVRSANQNAAAVGLQGEPTWGIAGTADPRATVATEAAAAGKKLMTVGAAAVGILLLSRFLFR